MTIFTSLRKLSDHHQWEQTYREIEIDRRERERGIERETIALGGFRAR